MDTKYQKGDFYKQKIATKIDYIDVNKILVSKEEQYGTKSLFKYFIGYNENDVIRSKTRNYEKNVYCIRMINLSLN